MNLLRTLATKIEPKLAQENQPVQQFALVETFGILWSLPWLTAALVWLVLATSWPLLRQEWFIFLLLLLLYAIFNVLSFTFRREAGKGSQTIIGGSMEGLVSWSAILIFGPTAIWLVVLYLLAHAIRTWPRLIDKGWRRTTLLMNLVQPLAVSTFSALLALWVYGRLGGIHPLPGLSWSALWPAAVATILLHLFGLMLMIPVLYGQNWAIQSLNQQVYLSPGDALRLVVFAQGFNSATLPFAILAAGLFAVHGLGIYLFFMAGGLLVNFLAYRFSQSLNEQQQRALELSLLEQLGREMLAAPPDLATLPDLLEQYAPRLTSGAAIAVWLDYQDFLYQYRAKALTELAEAQAGLAQRLAQEPDLSQVWLPEVGERRPLLLPVLGENGRLQGGIYTLLNEETANSLPALQALASQLGAAVHRAIAYEQLISSEKMARELEIAGKIQASFLPRERPNLPGWEIGVTLIPARQTSGDFYDFVELGNGRVGLIVADVADKGTGAALYMALSRTLIRTYALQFPEEPERALQAANERILADTQSDQFVTVFYGVLDGASGCLTYANAGHNPGLIVGEQIRELGNTGIPLGMFPDMSWQQAQVQLSPGQLLLLYTDGIPEATNSSHEEFGDERLQKIATAHVGQPATAVQTALVDAVQNFAGDAPQSDDITLLLVKRITVD
jgi:serine phosphatase RsbU (regulator of sigma subunit)